MQNIIITKLSDVLDNENNYGLFTTSYFFNIKNKLGITDETLVGKKYRRIFGTSLAFFLNMAEQMIKIECFNDCLTF